MEAVNWVCDDAIDEHVWVSEQTTPLQEAKVLDSFREKFWKTCPKEFGTSKEKWWVGDWVIGLICYQTVETMR